MEGLLIFGFAFGLLFAIVYFGFVKPFKENMKKSGKTWKDLVEQSERRYKAEKSFKNNKEILGIGVGFWLFLILPAFSGWWLYMEFSLIPLAIVWTIMMFFRVGKF